MMLAIVSSDVLTESILAVVSYAGGIIRTTLIGKIIIKKIAFKACLRVQQSPSTIAFNFKLTQQSKV